MDVHYWRGCPDALPGAPGSTRSHQEDGLRGKWADTEIDRSLKYLEARFPKCHAWQISAIGTKDYVTPDGIRVAPAMQLLRTLV